MNYLVYLTTHQTSVFKKLFTILDKEMHTANLEFTPEGLQIVQADNCYESMIYCFLEAKGFEVYNCPQSVTIGVNLVELTRTVKNLVAKSRLSFFVEDPNQSDFMYLGIKVETLSAEGEVIRETVYHFHKMDLDKLDMLPKNLERDYSQTIVLPATHLQSMINEIKAIGQDVVRLRYAQNQLSLYMEGAHGQVENCCTLPTYSSEIIDLYILMNKLIDIVKATPLSKDVTLYVRNDYPLFLQYDISNLGELRFCLALKNRPDDWRGNT